MKRIRKVSAVAALVMAMAMLLSCTALAVNGEAFVATDNLNLREGGSLDYNVIDAAPRGAIVTVNFDAGYGWYQVTYNGRTGYMAGYYLLFCEDSPAETAAAPAQAAETAAAPAAAPVTATYTAPVSGSGNGYIRGDEVRLRSGPSMNSETITYLYNNTAVNVHGACGAWYELDYAGHVGYVYGDYVVMSGQSVTYTLTSATTADNAVIYTEPVVSDVTYVDPTTPAAPAETPAPAAAPVSTPVHDAAAGQAIVDTAMQFLGVPYVWAGTSPSGFDCSGLVYYVYGLHGIKLNRVAQSMYYNGTDVDLNDLQAGDILLFGSSVYNIWHAAIYVGGGTFIHSPHSGEVVRTQGLSETYGMRLVAARRIV